VVFSKVAVFLLGTVLLNTLMWLVNEDLQVITALGTEREEQMMRMMRPV